MQQDELILGRYRPIEEVGSGGFATVQLAWDTRIQRRVAIKCIALDEGTRFAAMQDYLAQRYGVENLETRSFSGQQLEDVPGLREARTAAMLQDAHIVGVFDFEVQGATAYLIMEYVDGLTLTQLLSDFAGRLSLDILAAIFSSIAEALELAHAHQVLHLDIKPDNVLVNRQGQVKVTDFGLATLADAMGVAPAAHGGTIGYMPLEQMRQEALDARCDEWALASVSYEMIAGKNPFLAPDLRRAETVIEGAELVLPSLCRNDLDAGIDDVIFYALDPDREERYASVADFAEEMAPFLGNAARGHKELAVLVGQAILDEEESNEGTGGYGGSGGRGGKAAGRASGRPKAAGEGLGGFLEKVGPKGRAVAARLMAAFSTALLSALALWIIPPVQGGGSPFFWGLMAFCVLGALLKPWLGAVLAFGALCVALFWTGSPVLGIVFVLLAGLWWYFVGRRGNAPANVALMPVLFGAMGLGAITPLACGYVMRVREALMSAAFSLALALVLVGLSGGGSLFAWDAFGAFGWGFGVAARAGANAVQPDSPVGAVGAAIGVAADGFGGTQERVLELLMQPTTWCVAGAWLLAAVVTSLFCARRSRALAVVGMVAATALFAAALALGAGIESGFTWFFPRLEWGLPTLVAGILMVVACAYVVPVRPERLARSDRPDRSVRPDRSTHPPSDSEVNPR